MCVLLTKTLIAHQNHFDKIKTRKLQKNKEQERENKNQIPNYLLRDVLTQHILGWSMCIHEKSFHFLRFRFHVYVYSVWWYRQAHLGPIDTMLPSTRCLDMKCNLFRECHGYRIGGNSNKCLLNNTTLYTVSSLSYRVPRMNIIIH